MAHIRQILANLSISVSEFKKNPKTVIKAVKSEPIAVIINDKPAFYCVPADILESLYSKFYEMNEIQNIQELNNDANDPVISADDDSFGVKDIFQSIEDDQAAKLAADDDLVDPIRNSVADPLDDEVANQLNSSIDKHLFDSSCQITPASGSMDLGFNSLEEGTEDLSSFGMLDNTVDPVSAAFDDPLIDTGALPDTDITFEDEHVCEHGSTSGCACKLAAAVLEEVGRQAQLAENQKNRDIQSAKGSKGKKGKKKAETGSDSLQTVPGTSALDPDITPLSDNDLNSLTDSQLNALNDSALSALTEADISALTSSIGAENVSDDALATVTALNGDIDPALAAALAASGASAERAAAAASAIAALAAMESSDDFDVTDSLISAADFSDSMNTGSGSADDEPLQSSDSTSASEELAASLSPAERQAALNAAQALAQAAIVAARAESILDECGCTDEVSSTDSSAGADGSSEQSDKPVTGRVGCRPCPGPEENESCSLGRREGGCAVKEPQLNVEGMPAKSDKAEKGSKSGSTADRQDATSAARPAAVALNITSGARADISAADNVADNDSNSMRSLVSGPHSFSLEHVAKTYSPYKQKKLMEKRQSELKKELKASQKAQKKQEKAEKAKSEKSGKSSRSRKNK